MSSNRQLPLLNSRTCGDCTKCCEGYMSGVIFGKPFFPGNPCHYVNPGVGCTIYKDRPEVPCKSFQCSWLLNQDFPEWLKPSKSKVILTYVKEEEIWFLKATEAGQTMSGEALSYLVIYCLKNNINFCWEIQKTLSWLGSNDFLEVMKRKHIDTNQEYNYGN